MMDPADADILHLEDDDVKELRPAAGVEEPKPQAHLLLGDSIPHRMRDRLDVEPYDLLFNHSRPGNSWMQLTGELDSEITRWREATAAFECDLGTCILWMTGNDVYPRRGDTSHIPRLSDLETAIEDVITRIWVVAREVLVLGPLPRFQFDAGKNLADCPVFSAQQAIKRVCDDYHLNVNLLPLARCFTKSRKGWHVVANDFEHYFAGDRIHLSPAGEEAVLRRLPDWLKWQH